MQPKGLQLGQVVAVVLVAIGFVLIALILRASGVFGGDMPSKPSASPYDSGVPKNVLLFDVTYDVHRSGEMLVVTLTISNTQAIAISPTISEFALGSFMPKEKLPLEFGTVRAGEKKSFNFHVEPAPKKGARLPFKLSYEDGDLSGGFTDERVDIP